MKSRQLRVIYIRPSTYDDEGYPYRYWRGVLPSNTVSCLRGLTESVAASGALGEDVEVTVESYDETVEQLPMRRILRQSRRRDTQTLVAFAGVQTNQFARTTDLALRCREVGLQVIIGGFHVSGVLAMFGEPTEELQKVLDHGVSLFKGEAEVPGALARVLKDALEGQLQPIYDVTESPDILNAPVPSPDVEILKKFVVPDISTIDTSRGCPFGCTFCTVINVQGRKMRHRSAETVLRYIEENYHKGIRKYFFTDDNFARNPVWEQILDGLISMRDRGKYIDFMIQVDTQAHRISRFVDKLNKAGCYQVFVGMESLNPKNLEAMGKRQNHVEEYAGMVETWHKADILVQVGYIIGLPHDTVESVRKDVNYLCNHVKVDAAAFFMLTPLPGSKDHYDLVNNQVPLDADPNNYDSLHETFRHASMKPGDWKAAYHEASRTFYSPQNLTNVLLRAPRKHYWKLYWSMLWYRFCAIEGTHPMVSALIRLKDRKERRPWMPRESIFRFAWRRAKDWAWLAKTYAGLFVEFQELWMLTRKIDDPRWATLAELRTRWSDARQRIHDGALKGQWDAATEELRNTLLTASKRMQSLSQASRHQSRSLRKKLKYKAREIDDYLSTLDGLSGWQRLKDAERYVSESLLAGYEETAIRYVAKRRQINAYRRAFIDQIKQGRIFTLDIGLLPRLLLAELLLSLRFGWTILPKR